MSIVFVGENVPKTSYIRGLLAGKDDFIVKSCAKHSEEAREKGKLRSSLSCTEG